jgi:GDPmannose 4,6-dehydratase
MGNIDSLRDWGYAPDYVNAMWLILQQDAPDDYVIATGEMHSVREFIEKTFGMLDMPIRWEGSDANEIGIDKKTGKTLIRIDPKYYRPTEVEQLLGDATRARTKLGWKPEVTFEQLVEIMVKSDLEKFQRGEIVSI